MLRAIRLTAWCGHFPTDALRFPAAGPFWRKLPHQLLKKSKLPRSKGAIHEASLRRIARSHPFVLHVGGALALEILAARQFHWLQLPGREWRTSGIADLW